MGSTRRTDQPRILVIEHNDSLCKTLDQHLVQYEHYFATSWKEGKKQYSDLHPDIVFLDADITGDSDTVGVLEELLEEDASSYIVVMSSHLDEEEMQIFLDSGAKAAISTPPKEADVGRNIVDFMMGQ